METIWQLTNQAFHPARFGHVPSLFDVMGRVQSFDQTLVWLPHCVRCLPIYVCVFHWYGQFIFPSDCQRTGINCTRSTFRRSLHSRFFHSLTFYASHSIATNCFALFILYMHTLLLPVCCLCMIHTIWSLPVWRNSTNIHHFLPPNYYHFSHQKRSSQYTHTNDLKEPIDSVR